MKRWWGIRHIRFAVLSLLVFRAARRWGSVGIGLGWPNQADLDHLIKIRNGEA